MCLSIRMWISCRDPHTKVSCRLVKPTKSVSFLVKLRIFFKWTVFHTRGKVFCALCFAGIAVCCCVVSSRVALFVSYRFVSIKVNTLRWYFWMSFDVMSLWCSVRCGMSFERFFRFGNPLMKCLFVRLECLFDGMSIRFGSFNGSVLFVSCHSWNRLSVMMLFGYVLPYLRVIYLFVSCRIVSCRTVLCFAIPSKMTFATASRLFFLPPSFFFSHLFNHLFTLPTSSPPHPPFVSITPPSLLPPHPFVRSRSWKRENENRSNEEK